MRTFSTLLLLALIALSTAASANTTRYVTTADLKITLRSGQSTEHQIVRMLPHGTAVKVLEIGDKGYTRIRTKENIEGWIISRYLSNEPAAAKRLASLQESASKMKSAKSKIEKKSAQLGKATKELRQQVKKLTKENRALTQEVVTIRRTAANALGLDEDNRALNKQLLVISRDLDTLQQENLMLKDRSDRDWFVAGGGVVLAGILLGLLIPKIRWRKKSSWNSL
ncbi:MAG: TIGR04211 family SH3 domain-containing protein [Gammaproteobacteria bacterium]|nr:TIGR04211 family SH3 domain-containing protein [Gammaproteobacteria bacterium]